MMPGMHRLGHAERSQLVDQADVVLGVEEELGDGEVGAGAAWRPGGGGRSARSGERGWTSGWAATPTREAAARRHVLDQLAGVGVVAGLDVGRVAGRVAAEGQDVLDARGAVGVEDLGDLGPPVARAGEVGHRRDRRLPPDPGDDLVGALRGCCRRRRRSPRRSSGRAARARRSCAPGVSWAASVFGGKNSKENVRPSARRSAIRAMTAPGYLDGRRGHLARLVARVETISPPRTAPDVPARPVRPAAPQRATRPLPSEASRSRSKRSGERRRRRQCRKWRSPVNTMAMPCSSAAAMTSASRTLPPGWMTARTPASATASRPSRNGKKASLAQHAPDGAARRPCSTAMRAESTRFCCPAPIPTAWPSVVEHDGVRAHRRARPATRRPARRHCASSGCATVDHRPRRPVERRPDRRSCTSRPPSMLRRSSAVAVRRRRRQDAEVLLGRRAPSRRRR